MLSRHRPRVLIASALAGALLGLTAAPVNAGPPADRLRALFADVNAILADPATEDRPLERVARVRRLVADITDIDAAAAAAIGPAWTTWSGTERSEFAAVFAELIERAYVGRLAGAVRVTGGVALAYLDETVTGDEAVVKTALGGRGGYDARIEYRMTLRGGAWRVRDIVLDGVSTVENYRAQFARLLLRDSRAGVINAVRAKLAEDSILFARLELKPPPAVASAQVPPDVVVAPMPEELQPLVALPTRTDLPRRREITPATPVARRVPPAPAAGDERAVVPPAMVPPAPAVAVPSPVARSFDVGLALAVASVVIGVGLIYVGWRIPARSRTR